MNRTGFTFEVFAEIEFTAQEVATLRTVIAASGDSDLRGLHNEFRGTGLFKKLELSHRELTLLCRVVENFPSRGRTEFWKRLERDLHDQRRAVAAKRETLR